MLAICEVFFYTEFHLVITVTFCSRDCNICVTDIGGKAEKLARNQIPSLTEIEPLI